MSVLIIDYGMGNLGSVLRACEECGFDAFISDNPEMAQNADKLILPGVGHFEEAMLNLHKSGWADVIIDVAKNKKTPLLGICLGMQLLCTSSQETSLNDPIKGLNLISGHIKKMQSTDIGLRVPHVGWNDITLNGNVHTPYLQSIENGTDFYFVHSYHAIMDDADTVWATTDYGTKVTAIIGHDNIIGTQFHPEKSSRHGFQLLKNFLRG